MKKMLFFGVISVASCLAWFFPELCKKGYEYLEGIYIDYTYPLTTVCIAIGEDEQWEIVDNSTASLIFKFHVDDKGFPVDSIRSYYADTQRPHSIYNCTSDNFLERDGSYREFWNKENLILKRKCDYYQGRLQGKAETFYDNGVLEESGWFFGDKREGEWITYQITGDTVEVSNFFNDEPHGFFVNRKNNYRAFFWLGDQILASQDENLDKLERDVIFEVANCVTKGQEMLDIGKHQSAAKLFEKGLMYADLIELYFLYGLAKYNLGLYEAAIENLEKSTGYRFSDRGRANQYIGYSYLQLDDNKSAIQHLELAVGQIKNFESQEERALLWSILGATYLALDRPDIAILRLGVSISIDDSKDDVFANRAKAYLATFESSDDRKKGAQFNTLTLAMDDINRAIAVAPYISDYWMIRGYLRLLMGEIEVSVTDLRRSLDLLPSNKDARKLLLSALEIQSSFVYKFGKFINKVSNWILGWEIWSIGRNLFLGRLSVAIIRAATGVLVSQVIEKMINSSDLSINL